MDVLLIGGLWLDGSAWDDVAAALEPLGYHPVPVSLPGILAAAAGQAS